MPRLSTDQHDDLLEEIVSMPDSQVEEMQALFDEGKARRARADVETSVAYLREAGVPVAESASDLVPLKEAALPAALSPAEEQHAAELDALEVEDQMLEGLPLKPTASASDRAAAVGHIRESRRRELVR